MPPTLESLKAEHPEWCFICGHGGGLCGGNAHAQHRSPALSALTAAKLEDEATIREKDARIAELKQVWKSNRRAMEAAGAVLTFPIPGKPTPYSWNNGSSVEDFTTFVSALDSWGTECFAQNQALRAQLSAEQAAHAATREELRKADEALIEACAMDRDPNDHRLIEAYQAALSRRQAQRAADAAKEE